MSQVGNQVGDHSSFEVGSVPPVDPRVPIIDGKPAPTIQLSAEEIAKIEAIRNRRGDNQTRYTTEEYNKRVDDLIKYRAVKS